MYTTKKLFFCLVVAFVANLFLGPNPSWAENRTLIMAYSSTVNQGQYKEVIYANPAYYDDEYVYTVEFAPYSGDADIYLHEKVSGTWHKLKESVNGGTNVAPWGEQRKTPRRRGGFK